MKYSELINTWCIHRDILIKHVYFSFYIVLLVFTLTWDLHSFVLAFYLILFYFYESSQHSNLFSLVQLKIKCEFLSKSELEQIIVQTLFAHADFIGCVLQTPSLELVLSRFFIWDQNAIVEFSPSADLFNDIGYGPFFCTFLWLWNSWTWLFYEFCLRFNQFFLFLWFLLSTTFSYLLDFWTSLLTDCFLSERQFGTLRRNFWWTASSFLQFRCLWYFFGESLWRRPWSFRFYFDCFLIILELN